LPTVISNCSFPILVQGLAAARGTHGSGVGYNFHMEWEKIFIPHVNYNPIQ
jgi:hypothetical protein